MKKNKGIILEPEVDDLCFLLARILARPLEKASEALTVAERSEPLESDDASSGNDDLNGPKKTGRKQ